MKKAFGKSLGRCWCILTAALLCVHGTGRSCLRPPHKISDSSFWQPQPQESLRPKATRKHNVRNNVRTEPSCKAHPHCHLRTPRTGALWGFLPRSNAEELLEPVPVSAGKGRPRFSSAVSPALGVMLWIHTVLGVFLQEPRSCSFLLQLLQHTFIFLKPSGGFKVLLTGPKQKVGDKHPQIQRFFV